MLSCLAKRNHCVNRGQINTISSATKRQGRRTPGFSVLISLGLPLRDHQAASRKPTRAPTPNRPIYDYLVYQIPGPTSMVCLELAPANGELPAVRLALVLLIHPLL